MLTHLEAQRAIYIDFECLQTEPQPTPELLGVLTGDQGDQFEQLILDPALAPARVARKRCRVAGLQAGLRDILTRADAENRVIVGWSFFDRDVAARAAPALAARIHQRYRNALQTAKPWRAAIHPAVKIAKDDEFAAKHTLDKHAKLAGYPDAHMFAGAQPAKWIQHTLAQLRATGGRYRPITSQARRDWHRVLDYNAHDCFALRYICSKAASELGSWRSFLETTFCVNDDRRSVCFKAGSRSRRLGALLERHGATRWAFMTAWNPAPRTLSREENDSRQQALIRDLEGKRIRYLPGTGSAADGSWSEESLLALGISRAAAVALARKYGQLAILHGEQGGPAELVSCVPAPPS